ncbi:hypothetical protein BUALT_Bualt17G0050700 [Buddleja alternifolia]|uniref:Bet v I/Major latex protein domain-containing protein n=1 Tax=Buddleja alternifolia TaxID=168488 RepID=A0AAV6W7Y2_9LAMI|nr:hypothetical protein BUALT_Bualt17G0050500 [Buddleja alternifolia]KAG8366189.1 hypothetical protein BUALT_Bualt17G0050700 [Buddleja alternifolia]
MASKLEVKVEVKSSAEKIWESIIDSVNVLPKAMPHKYESIEIVEGDGKSAGTVNLIKYKPGMSSISTTKEKFELVDEANKTLSYSVVDGDVLKLFNFFKGTLTVTPKADHGSLVKWSCEFVKASDEVPSPDHIRDFAVKNFQDLDAYLLGVA